MAGLLGKILRFSPKLEPATAHPVNFTGKGVYQRSFGATYGIVLEDDGETGYLYATNGNHTDILDALHLYDVGTEGELKPGEEIMVVHQEILQKVGIYYRDAFHAIVDFKRRRACCLSGFPPPLHSGYACSHEWDASMVEGLL